MLGQKVQNNTTRKTNNNTRGNKSERTSERRNTKKILRQYKGIDTKKGTPK